MKNKILTFHICGLTHLPIKKEIGMCAFNQKISKLAKMLKLYNHKVYFYGIETSDVECDENINVLDYETYKNSSYGKYDWNKEFFKFDDEKINALFNKNMIREIEKRYSPNDFLLLPFGHIHKPAVDYFGDKLISVESGIGYSYTFAKYRVFESYAWYHHKHEQNSPEIQHWLETIGPFSSNANRIIW
jgi:hypothetical protein